VNTEKLANCCEHAAGRRQATDFIMTLLALRCNTITYHQPGNKLLSSLRLNLVSFVQEHARKHSMDSL